MKKIMFNDKFGLTYDVLNGAKTMTRRSVDRKSSWLLTEAGTEHMSTAIDYAIKHAPYKVGEVVAISQSYFHIYDERLSQYNGSIVEWAQADKLDFREEIEKMKTLKQSAGYSNKMFVNAEYMPHHIKFTDLRVERLQDITEEDCLKEGIKKAFIGYYIDGLYVKDWTKEAHHETEDGKCAKLFPTAREAFAVLIDKVEKKGTWKSNPWVYVYEFELVD